MRQRTVQQKKDSTPTPDIAKSYNEFKTFKGKQYSGMKVGRSHKWYYDKGEWKEKKVTPDKWEFSYCSTERAYNNNGSATLFPHCWYHCLTSPNHAKEICFKLSPNLFNILIADSSASIG